MLANQHCPDNKALSGEQIYQSRAKREKKRQKAAQELQEVMLDFLQVREGGEVFRKILVGCGGLAVIGFLLLVIALLLVPAEDSEQADSGSGPGSGETFTDENYGELVSSPDEYEGAAVDIAGRVFASPEREGGELFFQMWADPADSEWNTVVHAPDMELARDDHVRVRGTVAGSLEGENALGGVVDGVLVEADEVEVVEASEAIDPAVETVEVDSTVEDQGFTLTVERVEIGEETTRVHLNARNDTNAPAALYNFNARIIQGERQIDEADMYGYDLQEPQSEMQPGVRTEGVMGFGAVEPGEPFRVEFEWSSEDYQNIDPNPLVFEVTP